MDDFVIPFITRPLSIIMLITHDFRFLVFNKTTSAFWILSNGIDTNINLFPCFLKTINAERVNSSPLSASYMRQWTGPSLVQVNYLNQCWLIVNWTLGNKFQWNLNRNYIIFIQEKPFENVVCQNGGHFVQGRRVKAESRSPLSW